jgi:hypothetical protein
MVLHIIKLYMVIFVYKIVQLVIIKFLRVYNVQNVMILASYVIYRRLIARNAKVYQGLIFSYMKVNV